MKGFTTYYTRAKERTYNADEVDAFIEKIRDHRAEFRHTRYIDWLHELDSLLAEAEN